MNITQLAEITTGVWCEFTWNTEAETIQVGWFDGKPPDNPTAVERKRMDEALDEFMAAVRLEFFKKVLEQQVDNDD